MRPEDGVAPQLDKYLLFVERALGLLNGHGILGMIVPNKFMTIETGKPLRELLTTDYHVSRLVDFDTIQVFPGRSTYTCILLATPEKVPVFTRQRVTSLASFIEEPLDGGIAHPSSELTAEPWAFPPEALSRHFASIQDKCSKLSALANVFVGLQTSNDNAYIIEPSGEVGGLYSFEDLTGHESKVEKRLCRPCLLDVSLEGYGTPVPNKQIIFPYTISNGRATLIPIERLATDYPFAHAYLTSIKGVLETRAYSPRSGHDDWYRFGRSQSLAKFNGKPHLIWPVLSQGPKYVIDRSGTVMFTGGGNGPYYGLELKDETPESIEYVQAALSYWLTELLVRCKTSVFRGDYYAHSKQFVAELPIRRIDFGSHAETELHDKVVSIVRQLNDLVTKRDAAATKSDAELFARSIEAGKRSLKAAMDQLYETDADLERAVGKSD